MEMCNKIVLDKQPDIVYSDDNNNKSNIGGQIMGREVRRVPKDWEHPKDDKGRYEPMHTWDHKENLDDWMESLNLWNKGLVPSYKEGEDTKVRPTGESFEDYYGNRPNEKYYMPQWPELERTHYQMYENVSEGTPLSPPMESIEELARYLSDNGANAGAGRTATYEQWLDTCQTGWAPSMIGIAGVGMVSGVEGLTALPKTNKQ